MENLRIEPYWLEQQGYIQDYTDKDNFTYHKLEGDYTYTFKLDPHRTLLIVKHKDGFCAQVMINLEELSWAKLSIEKVIEHTITELRTEIEAEIEAEIVRYIAHTPIPPPLHA